jgi:hypothetical protein
MSEAAQAGLSVVAGALTTLSPCVFPLLPLILGGAVQRHRAAPVLMGIGMAMTFTVIGLLVGGLGGVFTLEPSRAGFGRAREWVTTHGATAKRALGLVLVGVGILILTGGDHRIETWVNDRLPDAWLALTTRV